MYGCCSKQQHRFCNSARSCDNEGCITSTNNCKSFNDDRQVTREYLSPWQIHRKIQGEKIIKLLCLSIYMHKRMALSNGTASHTNCKVHTHDVHGSAEKLHFRSAALGLTRGMPD